MSTRRGRPPKVAPEIITALVLKYGDQILLPDKKIIGKTDKVWGLMSHELKNGMTPESLYTIVTCNRHQVRDKLLLKSGVGLSDDTRSDVVLDVDSNPQKQSIRERLDVLIPISRDKFEKLVVERLYKRTGRKNQQTYRERKVLKPGEWQHMVTSSIWEETQLKCGFHFQNHYLSGSGTTGLIQGNCKCGSNLTIRIEDPDPKHCNIYFDCTIVKGLGPICGKLYLRAPIGEKVARELLHKAIHVYQAEQADKLMAPGDPEPPHLYSTKVMSQAKHQYISDQYLDHDPIKAIAIMKATKFQNVVHNIGCDPFCVHYWSHYQTQTWRLNSDCCLCIDATGGIILKIDKPEKAHCKPIFLNLGVINCPDGQVSILQGLNESGVANAIQYWLMEWIRSGAPIPREVITDASRALLTGVIRACTNYGTIEEYANACKSDKLPGCYVRMDVAHFIKTYASFLRNTPRRIKIFYLAAIGKLVVTRSIDEARTIVKNLLLDSRCETEGTLSCGRVSQCEMAKAELKETITGVGVDVQNETQPPGPYPPNVCLSNLVEGVTVECNHPVNHLSADENVENGAVDGIDKNGAEDVIDGYGENEWSTWAANINEEVDVAKEEVGDRDNAHYLPKFAERLVKDIKLIPLWSCILRDEFGYGRVPASSASVEGEFNKIKNHLLKHCTTPMRPDVFLEKHIDYLNGRIKIVNARQAASDTAIVQEPTSPSSSENEMNADEPDDVQLESPFDNRAKTGTTEESSCSACARFGTPQGGHLCDICNEPVHAISPCSVAIGCEEGYGTRRRCMKCHQNKSTPQIVAARELEAWRGEGLPQTETEKKRKAKYLGERTHEIKDKLMFEKNKNLPIIKAGDTNTLKALEIENEKVCFFNTRGFDSLFQLTLVLFADWPTLRQQAEKLKDIDSFIAMVLDTLEKGLRTKSYRLRAEILIEEFKKDGNKIHGGCRLIDCEINVGWLASSLFAEMPSLVETSQCNLGCPPRVKRMSKLIIDATILRDEKEFENVLNTKLQAGPIKCCNPKKKPPCAGMESTTVNKIGDLVVLDVADFGDDSDRINLKKLPRRLRDPLKSNDFFELMGFVHYTGPSIRTRRSGDGIGHYTAVAQRCDRVWLQYDDTSNSVKKISVTFIANPKVMVFKREKIK